MAESFGRILILATMVMAGCSSESTSPESDGGTGGTAGTGGGGQVTLTGSINASGLPSDTKMMVFWSVSSSSPDQMAKFGEGAIDGSSFTVTFSGAPPTEALNAWGNGYMGVGVAVAVPGNLQVPDGLVQDEDASAIESQLLAINFRQMILWRTGTVEDPAWASSFAEGSFSCGQCVEATEGTFDSIAPMSCEQLVLWPPELAEGSCNWT